MKANTQEKYSVRPAFKDKFNPNRAKELMKDIVEELFPEEINEPIQELTAKISEAVRDALKDEYLNRYKVMVQTVIGEKKGIKAATRCFWDSSTDTSVSYFQSSTLHFCAIVAYAIYIY